MEVITFCLAYFTHLVVSLVLGDRAAAGSSRGDRFHRFPQVLAALHLGYISRLTKTWDVSLTIIPELFSSLVASALLL